MLVADGTGTQEPALAPQPSEELTWKPHFQPRAERGVGACKGDGSREVRPSLEALTVLITMGLEERALAEVLKGSNCGQSAAN